MKNEENATTYTVEQLQAIYGPYASLEFVVKGFQKIGKEIIEVRVKDLNLHLPTFYEATVELLGIGFETRATNDRYNVLAEMITDIGPNFGKVSGARICKGNKELAIIRPYSIDKIKEWLAANPCDGFVTDQPAKVDVETLESLRGQLHSVNTKLESVQVVINGKTNPIYSNLCAKAKSLSEMVKRAEAQVGRCTGGGGNYKPQPAPEEVLAANGFKHLENALFESQDGAIRVWQNDKSWGIGHKNTFFKAFAWWAKEGNDFPQWLADSLATLSLKPNPKVEDLAYRQRVVQALGWVQDGTYTAHWMFCNATVGLVLFEDVSYITSTEGTVGYNPANQSFAEWANEVTGKVQATLTTEKQDERPEAILGRLGWLFQGDCKWQHPTNPSETLTKDKDGDWTLRSGVGTRINLTWPPKDVTFTKWLSRVSTPITAATITAREIERMIEDGERLLTSLNDLRQEFKPTGKGWRKVTKRINQVCEAIEALQIQLDND